MECGNTSTFVRRQTLRTSFKLLSLFREGLKVLWDDILLFYVFILRVLTTSILEPEETPVNAV